MKKRFFRNDCESTSFDLLTTIFWTCCSSEEVQPIEGFRSQVEADAITFARHLMTTKVCDAEFKEILAKKDAERCALFGLTEKDGEYVEGDHAHTLDCKDPETNEVKYEITPYHPKNPQEWGCMLAESFNAPFPINISVAKSNPRVNHSYFLKKMTGKGAANDYLAMVLIFYNVS